MSLNDQMRQQCLLFCDSSGASFKDHIKLTTELSLMKWYDGSGYTIYRGDYNNDGHTGDFNRVAEISETCKDAYIHISYCIFVATSNIPQDKRQLAYIP